jgi:hypothetical protein
MFFDSHIKSLAGKDNVQAEIDIISCTSTGHNVF